VVENVEALNNLAFSAEELAEIEKFAREGGINIWSDSSDHG
jgi:L-glyceraldehyde 3-phosphate reductase